MSDESDAADLQRYDAVSDMLYDEVTPPSEDRVIEALNDCYVSIRAEALDYVLQLSEPSGLLIGSVRERYNKEESEQCIGRLILMASRLGDNPSFPLLPAGISRFEVDYLAIWSAVALAVQPGGSSTIALSYTGHPDTTLSELARNLLLEYCFDERQLAERQTLLGA